MIGDLIECAPMKRVSCKHRWWNRFYDRKHDLIRCQKCGKVWTRYPLMPELEVEQMIAERKEKP